MAVFIVETAESRAQQTSIEPDQQGVTLKYFAYGSDLESDIDTAIQSTVPGYFNLRRIQNYKKSPRGAGVWDVDVNYGTKLGANGGPGVKPTGFLTYNFDTGDDKVKLLNAFSAQYFRQGAAPVNYNGAIGIKKQQGKSKAEGIDVQVNAFNFTIARTFNDEAALTSELIDLLEGTSWCVNADVVEFTILGIDRHYDPGELLFKNQTGSQKSGGFGGSDSPVWEGEVTLKFAVQRNLVDVTIAGIPHVTKRGWDYLEVIYEDDVVADKLIPKAVQVNVNQVFPYVLLMPLFS